MVKRNKHKSPRSGRATKSQGKYAGVGVSEIGFADESESGKSLGDDSAFSSASGRRSNTGGGNTNSVDLTVKTHNPEIEKKTLMNHIEEYDSDDELAVALKQQQPKVSCCKRFCYMLYGTLFGCTITLGLVMVGAYFLIHDNDIDVSSLSLPFGNGSSVQIPGHNNNNNNYDNDNDVGKTWIDGSTKAPSLELPQEGYGPSEEDEEEDAHDDDDINSTGGGTWIDGTKKDPANIDAEEGITTEKQDEVFHFGDVQEETSEEEKEEEEMEEEEEEIEKEEEEMEEEEKEEEAIEEMEEEEKEAEEEMAEEEEEIEESLKEKETNNEQAESNEDENEEGGYWFGDEKIKEKEQAEEQGTHKNSMHTASPTSSPPKDAMDKEEETMNALPVTASPTKEDIDNNEDNLVIDKQSKDNDEIVATMLPTGAVDEGAEGQPTANPVALDDTGSGTGDEEEQEEEMEEEANEELDVEEFEEDILDEEAKESAVPTAAATPLPKELRLEQFTYTYSRRGKEHKVGTRERHDLGGWGSWQLEDDKASTRPKDDYCGAYPNRDIPWKDIPDNAWQKDRNFVKAFLKEGQSLVVRAMRWHLEEYGFGATDYPGKDEEERIEMSPYKLDIVDNDEVGRRLKDKNENAFGGWMTQKSHDGLVRRLLHAVVSGSDFNLVMGGHSAAAGHGNHFQQSYTMQFQMAMEPIFARLGIKHFSRNIGMGGLGTIQNAMGAQSIYGKNVDILVWDSGMTEPSDSPEFDIFARQGILGSDRAPMMWSGTDDGAIYPQLHEHADVDYMMYGTGMGAIPVTESPEKANDIPYAARYLKCSDDYLSLCKENRYEGICWINRTDVIPPTPQKDEPGGRASWHGGNREHRLQGRILSFTVLRALHEALEVWSQQPDLQLEDHLWHVSSYYANIKSKVATLEESVGECYNFDKLPPAFCKIPFKARTEFTPRANPEATSLRSIMKPFGLDQLLPDPGTNIYDPPDVFNPVLHTPGRSLEYLSVAENGIPFKKLKASLAPLDDGTLSDTSKNQLFELTVDTDGEPILPGLGWGVNTPVSPERCDGTYDSFCGRGDDNDCLLYGHNDHRGGLSFDSLSGWGIFTLKNVKEGYIYVKMDSWRKAENNPVTEGWTEVNNGTDVGTRALTDLDEPSNKEKGHGNLRRSLKDDPNAKFCSDLVLEFAYKDKIVQLTSDEILGPRHSLVQRVVQVWKVMNWPDFAAGETVDLELGIRLRGCDRQHVFWLTHIYWA